jgi:hypothetical protein
VKIIFCILLSITSAASAECLLPHQISPAEVDILSGQTIAMLKSVRHATVCVCDERGLEAVLFQVFARQPVTSTRTYFVLGQGFCRDLVSGWPTDP